MALYMNYANKKIKGDVTAKGYENWINLDSFQFGTGRGIGMGVGDAANREVSLPSVSEINVSKMLDSASALLLRESLAGSEGVTIVIALVRTGKEQPELVGTFTLENALVSGYSISSGGDRPVESISLNFSKIEVDLQGANVDNKNGEKVKVGYDLAVGAPL